MTKFVREAVTDKGETSSARVINIVGAITGTVLVIYHGICLDTLSYDVFAVYLGYCGGVYGLGKYIGRKYDTDSMEYNERRKATSYSSASRVASSKYDHLEID